MTDEELIEEIEEQISLMIALSTGGYSRIDVENAGYKTRRQKIREGLAERKLTDPNTFRDLWRWYGKWSSGDLQTYSSRRSYINNMYEPLIVAIQRKSVPVGSELFTEPTGWNRVDRTVDRIRESLEYASEEEDFQSVGLLCRECIISVAQAIYNPSIHKSLNRTIPSSADANGMIELYINNESPGKSNEEIRCHAKAALSLANALQHRRTADFRDAALCAEATISVVNLIAIILGLRDPD